MEHLAAILGTVVILQGGVMGWMWKVMIQQARSHGEQYFLLDERCRRLEADVRTTRDEKHKQVNKEMAEKTRVYLKLMDCERDGARKDEKILRLEETIKRLTDRPPSS